MEQHQDKLKTCDICLRSEICNLIDNQDGKLLTMNYEPDGWTICEDCQERYGGFNAYI